MHTGCPSRISRLNVSCYVFVKPVVNDTVCKRPFTDDLRLLSGLHFAAISGTWTMLYYSEILVCIRPDKMKLQLFLRHRITVLIFTDKYSSFADWFESLMAVLDAAAVKIWMAVSIDLDIKAHLILYVHPKSN
jgi:hypothetical protein